MAAMPVNGNRMPPIEWLQISSPVEAIGCDPERPCEPDGSQPPVFVAEGIAGGAPVTFDSRRPSMRWRSETVTKTTRPQSAPIQVA